MKKTIINNKILVLVILITLLGFSNNAEALKRAIFPDGKNLQPLPSDAYPNISGNVNSEVTPFFKENPSEKSELKEVNNQEVIEKEVTSSKNNYFYYYIGGIIILLIIFVFYYKNRKLD